MADIVSQRKRSSMMRQVSQRDTPAEVGVRKFLFAKGFRFRKNDRRLPGSPDIVLPRYRTAIFVHGCFWHQHQGCSKSRRPTSNQEFWNEKLDENVKRDQRKEEQLRALGWRVCFIWECEYRDFILLSRALSPLLDSRI